MLGIPKKTEATKEEREPVAPLVDVFENDGEFLLVADLPGVPQGGAEVTLEHNRLTLEANGVRRFRREFAVPASVEADKVSAAMKAGVLTLRLPKREPYKPRQIQVQSA